MRREEVIGEIKIAKQKRKKKEEERMWERQSPNLEEMYEKHEKIWKKKSCEEKKKQI